LQSDKYAQVERERRFLLDRLPDTEATAVRRIVDRYLVGTRLRLRHMHTDCGLPQPEFKLTQKVPAVGSGAVQGLITNTYLSRPEYDLLATLPAAVLTKTRHSVPPLGIDVFDPPLDGLILAEAEFVTDADARAFARPDPAVAEVTDDVRFTGGRLVMTSRCELMKWLREYGIAPPP
jgi:hypothetical protein